MEIKHIWYLPSSRTANLDLVKHLIDEYEIEPAIWLGDDKHKKYVLSSLPDCLLLEHSQLLQITVPQVGDLSTLKLLSSFFQSDLFRKWSPHIMQEFNRYPTLSHTRSLDRDVVMRNIFATLIVAVSNSKKIRLAVFSETPHDPVILCAYVLCKFLSIPTLFFQPSNIGPFLLPRTEIDQALALSESTTPTLSKSVHSDLNQCIDSSVAQILKTEPWPYMVEQRKFDDTNYFIKKLLRRISLFFLKLRSFARTKYLSEFSEEILRFFLFRHFQKRLLEGAKRINQFSIPSTPEEYGLFPLHFEPERTSNPEAFPWLIQADAVVASRALLPEQSTLIVKEHYSQLTAALLGYLGRSHKSYDYISGLYKTVFVETETEASSLISKASLVFTLTGTVGIEAALHNKPVVYFGHPWWEGVPGTYPYEEVKDGVISELVGSPRNTVINNLRESAFTRMIPGTGTEDEDLRWKPFFRSYSELLDVEKKSKAKIISEILMRIHEE